MTIVTPSSLKWLITQYQSRQQRLTNINHQVKALLEEKHAIDAEIESLAKVIDLHEIPISAEDIPGLRRKSKHSGLPYGAVTRLIYQYLGSLPVDKDAPVTDIFYHCSRALSIADASDDAHELLLKSVRKQLKNLAYNGKIKMSFKGTNFEDSRYRLFHSKASTLPHMK
jgi:hypothetical protein